MHDNAPSTVAGGLEPLARDLFATGSQALGFAPNFAVRCFLLRREGGNILLNASEGALEAAEAIDQLGGVKVHMLGHWHEAGTGAAAIARRFGAPVWCHAADREEAEKEVAIARTFDGAHRAGDDLEVIPIPGHTPGSTAYLWHGPETRCLFTADSLFVKDGELRGAVLESSDRGAFLASLSRLKEIQFDLLVPWLAAKGAAPATAYEPDRFRRGVEAVIARVEAGDSG